MFEFQYTKTKQNKLATYMYSVFLSKCVLGFRFIYAYVGFV